MANTIKKLGLAALLAAMPVNYSHAKGNSQDSNSNKKWEFSIGPSFGFSLSSPAKDFLDSEYNKIVSRERTSGDPVPNASNLNASNPIYMGVRADVERRLTDRYSAGVFMGYNSASQSASNSGVSNGAVRVNSNYNIKTSNISLGAKGKAHFLNEKLNPYAGLGLNMVHVSGDYTIDTALVTSKVYNGSFSGNKVMPSLDLGADGKVYNGLSWDASFSLPVGNSVKSNWTETKTQPAGNTSTDISADLKMPIRFNLALKWIFGK